MAIIDPVSSIFSFPISSVPYSDELAWEQVHFVLKARGYSSDFKDGLTPLKTAIKLKDLELFQKLLSLGCSTYDQKQLYEETTLTYAIKQGCEEIALLLIQRASYLNLTAANGFCYLHEAISVGSLQICKSLIEKGLNIHATFKQECLFSSDVRDELPEKGPQNYIMSSLSFALLEGHLEIASFLIEKGATFDFQKKDLCDDDPLYIILSHAIYSKQSSLFSFVISFLKSKNILLHQLNVCKLERKTSLLINFYDYITFILDNINKEEIHSQLGEVRNKLLVRAVYSRVLKKNSQPKLEMCQLWIKHGADVNSLDFDGKPLLCLAMTYQDPELMACLLNAGANPNQIFQQEEGWTVLHMAVREGLKNIFELLLEHGANLEMRDSKGYTPLHHAVISNHSEDSLINQLLLKGANARVLSKEGETPLSLSKETSPLLKEKDAGLTEKCLYLNLLGHRFGLKGPLFEGSMSSITYSALADSLSSYLESLSPTYSSFNELPSLFREVINLENPFNYFLKKIEEKKLALIPLKWSGISGAHAISMVILDNFLCKCNRGEKSGKEPGIKIYEIQDSSKLQIVLEKLLEIKDEIISNPNFNSSNISEFQDQLQEWTKEHFERLKRNKKNKINLFNKEINQILKLKKLHYIANNYQQSGNCAWTAAKMSLKSVLILLCLQKNPEAGIKEILDQIKPFYRGWLTFDFRKSLEGLQKALEEPELAGFVDKDQIYEKILKRLLKGKKIDLLDILFKQYPNLLIKLFSNGDNLLHRAVKMADFELCHYLISKGVPVNVQNDSRDQPLDIALALEDVRLIGLLIEHEKPNDLGLISLHGFCLLASYKGIKLLVEGWKKVSENKKDVSFLKNAINKKDQKGKTPLLYTLLSNSFCKEKKEIVSFLLESGVDCTLVDHEGNGVLHHLALGHIDDPHFVDLFIEKGADMNARNVAGMTPLNFYCSMIDSSTQASVLCIQHTNIQKRLLELGADPNVASNEGIMPLSFLDKKEIIHLLIQKGAKVDVNGLYQRTPLHLTFNPFKPKDHKVQILVSHLTPDQINKQDEDGNTALHLLSPTLKKAKKYAELLIKHGADVQIKNANGETPAIVAVLMNSANRKD